MIEMVDMMAGIGGAWVGYHAVRLFGLMCFRMGAAFREWRYQRPAARASRQAERAIDIALELRARLEKVEAKETTSVGARVAILEERIEDIEDLLTTQADPAKGVADYRDAARAYFDKHGKSKKKYLPN